MTYLYKPVRSMVMEFLACFTIVFLTSFIPSEMDKENAIDNSKVFVNAFATFFLIMSLTWIALPISGAHFNPIISLGALINYKIDLKVFLMNVFG